MSVTSPSASIVSDDATTPTASTQPPPPAPAPSAFQAPRPGLPREPAFIQTDHSTSAMEADAETSPLERMGASVLTGQDGNLEAGRGDAEASWASFVDSYSRGQQWTHGLSPPTSAPAALPPTAHSSGSTSSTSQRSVPGSVPIPPLSSFPDVASQKEASYFPEPLGPYEEERRRVVKRFGLDGQGRRDAIDRCAAVAQAHFRTPTVIISLVLDDRQVLASEIGWEGERDHTGKAVYSPLRELPLDHDAMQRIQNEDCFVIEDARADWRFKQNPYAREGGSITFFASAAIHLPTAFPELPPSMEAALAVPKPPPTLPVGSICIIDRKPRTKEGFSEEDRMVLKCLADMIAREFQLGFEQQRRETEARQTLFLGEFLRTALVHPSRADKPLASDPHSKPHADLSSRGDIPARSAESLRAPLVFQEAAEQLQHLTAADTAVILDLRAFHAPFPPARFSSIAASLASVQVTGMLSPTVSQASESSSHSSVASMGSVTSGTGEGFTGEASRWGATFSGVAAGAGSVTVMGAEGPIDWQAAVEGPGCAAAVSHSLVAFYSDQISEFDSGTIPSPLKDLLPPHTEASLSVPVFDHDGRPCALLVLCSFVKYFRFEPTDRQFVENVGAVCVGSLMRRRILEADRAKLAFVSQISHELRTPLHGIGSQIELIREVSAPATLTKLKPLLDVADVCIASLREVLDDTLEFAKISNSTEAEASGRQRVLTAVDLEQLVEEVAKSSWARTQQNMNVSKDGEGNVQLGTTGAGGNVDVIIEMDERLDGWRALIDVGGLKRVLLNILGNSLKFTTSGSIKIMVYEIPTHVLPRQAGIHMIGFTIQDTGMGMSLEFVREALFLPFKQANAFSNGAGLGVSICDSIIRRMNGTLHYESTIGVGTTARISLPLLLVHTDSNDSDNFLPPSIAPPFPSHLIGPPRVRVISDELSSMLDPVHIMADAVTAAREMSDKIVPLPVVLPRVPVRSEDLIPFMEDDARIQVKALVVDDNQISRRILTTYLATKGIVHTEAENGEVAVAQYKIHRPNIIWMDVQMPVKDGLTASAEIRAYEAEHNLPPAHIVALTGLSSESRLHKASLTTGQIDEWLIKGGPSLKLLGEGLVRRQAALDELAARRQVAAAYQAAALAILNGHIPASLPDQLAFAALSLVDSNSL